MSSRTIEILLVEDNPGDVRLTLEAFKEGRVLNNFTVMSDGVEALAYLRRQGQYANAVQPDLILLDLNLPKKDGREVLAEIKIDERLVVPEILTQFLSGDDVSVILEKAGKNAKRLVLQLDADTMLAKLSGPQVHFEHAES